MGVFATIKKRFRSWQRDWMVDSIDAPTLRDILRELVYQMAKVTPSVNRSFWKFAGLVNAVDADEPGVGEILDLRRDNEVEADERLSEQFGQPESDSDDEERELSEEVQLINEGVQEIDIETQPRKLKQSQITNFLPNNNLKQIKNTTKSVTTVSKAGK